MKKIFLLSTVLLAVLLLLPLSVLNDEQKNFNANALTTTAPTTANPQAPIQKTETVKVLISSTNEIKEMPMEEEITPQAAEVAILERSSPVVVTEKQEESKDNLGEFIDEYGFYFRDYEGAAGRIFL